jgi:hypothetical protein
MSVSLKSYRRLNL